MSYLETLLVIRKYRNTIASEPEKEGMLPELEIDLILCVEYVQVQKVVNTVASSLYRSKDICNGVHV